MNSFILDFAKHDRNKNARILEKVLRDEYKAGCGHYQGYRFVFDEYCQTTHKRAGDKFRMDCHEMARSAKMVRVFLNLNDELTVKDISTKPQFDVESHP